MPLEFTKHGWFVPLEEFLWPIWHKGRKPQIVAWGGGGFQRYSNDLRVPQALLGVLHKFKYLEWQ
jgi:hypothetical protein